MVAALISKTSSGLDPEWRKGFWKHGGVKEASLISLSKLPNKISSLENGQLVTRLLLFLKTLNTG